VTTAAPKWTIPDCALPGWDEINGKKVPTGKSCTIPPTVDEEGFTPYAHFPLVSDTTK